MDNTKSLNQTSIKEYYINLYKLYNNAVNLLNGINQSLNTNSQDINVSLLNKDETITNVTIPSFLYLESRIEELSANFDSLVNLPDSGEGWISKNSDSYKINIARSNTAPAVPIVLNPNDIRASFRKNYLLKDFISPRTSLRLNLSNITENVHEIIVKKMIIYSENIYNNLLSYPCETYEEFKSYLYNYASDLTSSVNQLYEEYDIKLNIPCKFDKYISEFRIVDIPVNDDYTSNPAYYDDDTKRLVYNVVLNTLNYVKTDHPEQVSTLKKGDYLTLINNYGIYEITNIYEESVANDIEYHVTIQEVAGHNYLQSFKENTNMVFKVYKTNYNELTYVDVPVEENQYIVLFISAVYNNVRSPLSKGIPINLRNVQMVNFDSQEPLDGNISYMEYYNKYCSNIGAIIENLSSLMYPGPEDLTVLELKNIQTGADIAALVNGTNFTDLHIININKISGTTENNYNTLSSVVTSKSQDKENLKSINDSIAELKKQLIEAEAYGNSTTDIYNQLKSAEEERNSYQQNIINSAKTISSNKLDLYSNTPEYRIRGIIDTSSLEEYIANNYPKVYVIGIDVEYKAIPQANIINNETEAVETIDDFVFSNWQKMPSIDKDKTINIDEYNNITINVENTSNLENVIKWNQIDIPIKENESVIIRLRYKYSVGQPFINIYSPWTEEYTLNWDSSLTSKSQEIQQIIDENDKDIMIYEVMNKLDDAGLTGHISDNVVDNTKNASFYHSADHIFSGFMDENSSYISLKDKLMQMDNIIQKYQDLIGEYGFPNYDIEVIINDKKYELTENSFKNIIVPLHVSTLDNIIEETIEIKIRNNGVNNLKLYSLFTGSSDSLLSDSDNMESNKINIVIKNKNNEETEVTLDKSELLNDNLGINNYILNNEFTQKCNQLLYFRKNSPFETKTNIINNNILFTTKSGISIYPSNEMKDNIIIPMLSIDKDANIAYKAIAPGASVSLGLDMKYSPATLNEKILNSSEANILNMKYYIYFDIKTSLSSSRDVKHYGLQLKFIQET